MDSRLYIHCPILGQRTAPYFVLIFIPWGEGGGERSFGNFPCSYHLLLQTPSWCILFFAARGSCFVFSFVLKRDEEEPSLNTVAPVRVKRSLIAFFLFLLLLFASSFFLIMWWYIGYCPTFSSERICVVSYVENSCWSMCRTFQGHTSSKRVVDVHLQKRKDGGKKAVIECLCFIVRIFRLETSWLKTKWDAFDIFLQLFRKHKLEMSRFWCFVSLIFVSSLNILVCVKMWQFKNERCDNFL